MGPNILIIEDETKLRQSIVEYLGHEGFAVLGAADGEAGLRVAGEHQPDLVLLDLMLPGLPGLDVLRQLRANSRVPVIIVTARAEEADRVIGLELGADDYVTKPFSLRELAARVRAVLRRAGDRDEGSVPSDRVQRGPVTVDFERRTVEVQGRSVELTPTEFAILGVLVRYPGKVFSRLQLLEAAFGYAYEGYERSIDTHISNLRRKVEPDPIQPGLVLTVHGVGYRFNEKAGEPS